MKYSKFKIISVVFLSVFIILFNTPVMIDSSDISSIRGLKTSGFWNLSPFIIDDTGAGDYMWSQAVLQPWCSGSGTINDPYVIENITVDGGGTIDCIIVRNSTKHFILRNSTFTNSGWVGSPPYMGGITLIYVDNATLINNTCRDNAGHGINIYRSNGVTIRDNFLENNIFGIRISEGDSHKIINNSLTLNRAVGISIYNGKNNEIKENTLKNGRAGISLYYYSSNNTITANNIQIYSMSGIGASYYSNYNNISENLIIQAQDGIFLKHNNYYNIISSNNISYSTDNGIRLDGDESNNNLVTVNDISNSSGNGILIDRNCDFNSFESNTIINNTQFGIRIDDSDCGQNMIQNNYFLTNGKHALDLGSSTYWNSSKIGNYWDNYTGPDFNDDGIGDVPHNITVNPLIRDFLPIWEDGDDIIPPVLAITTPYEYLVIGHESFEFEITSKSLYINTTWYNVNGSSANYTFAGFSGSINQAEWDAIEEGILTVVFYANDSLGGIGDVNITIEKDVTLPNLVVHSPENSDVFSSGAPSYNITVIEKNFLTGWYTLDGGVTNFSISDFVGTISQTAWNNASSGAITITFYIKDQAGNIAYEAISVTKFIPETVIPGIHGYNLVFLIAFIVITSLVLFLSTFNKRKTNNTISSS